MRVIQGPKHSAWRMIPGPMWGEGFVPAPPPFPPPLPSADFTRRCAEFTSLAHSKSCQAAEI